MKHPALLSLLIASLVPLHGQQPAPSSATDIEVTLPTYEIAEKREKERPEPWTYGTVAGFEVLSCGSDKQTRNLVTELQKFRIALGAVWPEAVKSDGPPVAIIICGRGDTFAPFAPYHPDGRAASSTATTRFFNNRESAFLVIDATARTLQLSNDENTTIVGSTEFTGEFVVDHYQELIRAYIRYLVRRPIPPPPPWLAEGLTQLIGNVKYDRMGVTFGELDSDTEVARGVQPAQSSTGRDTMGEGTADAQPEADPVARDRDFTRGAGGLRCMPMDEFFAVEENSPDALNTIGFNWADQAHAFVHLCIYGENGRFQKGFLTFVNRLQTEPMSEKLFIACFGMNYEKFGSFLRRYTASTWYTSVRFDLQKGKLPDPEPLALRDATPAEIARIRGDALLLARDEETAFLALVDAYRAGERDPALLASLGLVESRRGHAEQALVLLEAATKAHVARPHAYTELARLRLVAAGSTADARLTKVQLASVLRPLFAARTQRPAIPETYALIAEAWERSATPPTKDNLAVLLEGAALFPSDSPTLLRSARLHQSIGLLREAGALADLGATWAVEADEKQELLAFKAALPAEAQVDLTKTAQPEPASTRKKPR